MTNEEIIKQLQDLKCHCQEMYDAEVKNGDPSNIIWGKDVEALTMAIKILEQQPSNSDISDPCDGCRYELNSTNGNPCYSCGKYKLTEQQPCEHKPFTIDELKNEDMQKLLREYQNQKVLVAEHDCLPSVTIISPSEDCISRTEALKHSHIEYDDDGEGHRVIYTEDIEELPSVTPQHTRWIPVSEKVADFPCLACDIFGQIFIPVSVITLNNRCFDGKDFDFDVEKFLKGKEVTLFSGKKVYELPREIVAWMPLPEPYKVKSEE